MGSRAESPPLPLFWVEDRNVPKRKVTARPVVKKARAGVMETEKLSHQGAGPSTPPPPKHPCIKEGIKYRGSQQGRAHSSPVPTLGNLLRPAGMPSCLGLLGSPRGDVTEVAVA